MGNSPRPSSSKRLTFESTQSTTNQASNPTLEHLPTLLTQAPELNKGREAYSERREWVGTGDLADVYRIQRKQDGQQLALKVYRKPYEGSFKSKVKLLNRESEIMKRMDHPLVIGYVDEFVIEGDQRCIVMESAQCGDLQKLIEIRIAKRYPFSEKEILRYFSMICVAVHYIHSNGIVHRDVNPSNILITNQGNIKEILKLAGFGMSVHEKQNIQNHYIEVYGADSAPNFMSPEQTRGQDPTKKSDIWALGVILYYFSTFRLPFDAGNRYAIQERIRTEEPEPLPETYSEDYRYLISKLLIKDYQKRPSISEVLNLPLVQNSIKLLMEETYHNVAVFSEIFKTIYRNDRTYFDRIYDHMNKLRDYRATLALSLIKKLQKNYQGCSQEVNDNIKITKMECQRLLEILNTRLEVDGLQPTQTFNIPQNDFPLVFLSVTDQYLFTGGDKENKLYLLEDGFTDPSVTVELQDGAYASLVLNQEKLVIGGWKYCNLYKIDQSSLTCPVELIDSFEMPSRVNKILAITEEKILCGQFDGHMCTIDVECVAGISVYQIKDGGDINDITLNDQGNQEYWIGSSKGLHLIWLDEEYNIIENHETHLNDKDIKCIAKVALDTFILGIRWQSDLLVVKRTSANLLTSLFTIQNPSSRLSKSPTTTYLSLIPLHLLDSESSPFPTPSPRSRPTHPPPDFQDATLFLLKDDTGLNLIQLDIVKQTALLQRIANVPDKAIGNNTHGMIVERKVDEIVITTTSGRWESKILVEKHVLQFKIRF